MKTQLTISECKVMWVVGATERLATLGLLSPDIPIKLSSSAVDMYLEIDEYRNILFESDFEVAQIFKSMVSLESPETKQEDIKPIIDLILKYKNDRTEIVKYALSHQTL